MVAIAALLLGGLAAWANDSRVVPVAPSRMYPATFSENLRLIAGQNLKIVGIMILSASVLGAYATILLGLNCFQIGHDLVSLWQGAPSELWYLLVYLPFEIAFLVLAAAASQVMGISVFSFLLTRRNFPIRPALRLVAFSLLCLLVAAMLESTVKYLRERKTGVAAAGFFTAVPRGKHA